MANTVLKRCPVCGGKLKVDTLYQYGLEYSVGKSGKVSKKYKKTDRGSMECASVFCEKEGCFRTNYLMEVEEPKDLRGALVFWDRDGYLYLKEK
ncbi:MAG: hypothetical protein IKO41_08995 [Lachnospiraceae bacterium]|nr:hypothetical protein [Lachnospiraceae bacterium]